MKQERAFPRLSITKKAEASVRLGHPWIYDAEVRGETDAERIAEATRAAPDFMLANLERLPDGLEALWPGAWHWAIYEVRDLHTAKYCQMLGARFVETMAVRSLMAAYGEHLRP